MIASFFNRTSYIEDETGQEKSYFIACIECEIFSKRYSTKEETEKESKRIRQLLEDSLK